MPRIRRAARASIFDGEGCSLTNRSSVGPKPGLPAPARAAPIRTGSRGGERNRTLGFARRGGLGSF